MDKGVLVLSGYNIRAVVAFCRWAREHQIPFHLVASGASDPILLTVFCDKVLAIRKHASLEIGELCGWIEQLRDHYSYHNVLLLPSTEYFNRFIIRNRVRIGSSGGVVPLVDEGQYELISDKYSFGGICLSYGISVPNEYQSFPRDYPFVAKPRNYASINRRQLKPYLIYSPADLERFKVSEESKDYYLQEYIRGRSIYFLACIPKIGRPVFFSQENLIQQPDGGSVVLARTSDFHTQQAAETYINVLSRLGFHGLIMIEVRMQENTQKYFMIEANPRLWGPIQLVVDNGIDMFGTLLRDHGFEVALTLAEKKRSAEYYFWSGGLNCCDQDPVYHNYSFNQLVSEFHLVNRNNLFLREDTMGLFQSEIGEWR